MFTAIVASDLQNGIAYQGKIPWNCPEDLKHFRETTTGHVVIMGRKTYESIGKPLADRINIVISSTEHASIDNLIWCRTPEAAIEECKKYADKKWFVIGGVQIYDWFLRREYVGEIIRTYIIGKYTCDQFLYIPFSFKLDVITKHPTYEIIKYTYYNDEEKDFCDLLNEIRDIGISKPPVRDQTVGRLSLFGETLSFSLENNTIPLLTTRKLFFRGIFEELMFILRGQTDNDILVKKKINVWVKNTRREFLDKCGLTHLPEGDLGKTYGFNLRHFGAKYINCKTDYTGQGHDQLLELVDKIRNDPHSRRLLLILYDPSAVKESVLPPCVYAYQFFVDTDKKTLSCVMTQRSSDIYVAGGWNVAMGALFTHLLAAYTNLYAKELIWNIADLHLYEDSHNMELMREQITREPYPFPKLLVKRIPDSITDFEFTDVELFGYRAHPAQNLNMIE